MREAATLSTGRTGVREAYCCAFVSMCITGGMGAARLFELP